MEDKIDVPEFDSIWNYDNPLETEIRFREILPNIKGSGNRSNYLQLLTQIARAEGLQLRFNDAHKTLNDAEKLLSQDLHTAGLRLMLERGRVYNSSGDKARAKEYFEKTFELALEYKEDYYAVDAAHMAAIVSEPDEAIRWNEKAVEIAESSSSERAKKWLGSLYNNLGWAYFDKKDYDNALRMFEETRKWYLEKGVSRWERVARWSIGKTYRLMGRLDEALSVQNEILNEIAESSEKKDGYVFEELGECYLIKQEKEKAASYFASAYEILSQDEWLRFNDGARLERMKSLSESGVEA